MEENEMTLDLYDLAGKMLRAFWRSWKAALCVFLAAALGTAVFTGFTYSPVYEAKTTFAVSKEMNGEENYLYNKDATDELSVSFESILYSDIMQDALCAQLGTQTMPARLEAGRIGTTNLFTVSARGDDPKTVREVIDAFLDNYARVFRSALMDIELKIIENPEDAVICNSPGFLRREAYVCGALAVLYIACLGAVALLRRTVTEEEEIKQYLRSDCLGTLPYIKSAERGKAPLITGDGSRYYEMKEAVGAIRRRMEKAKKDTGAVVFLITAASQKEGTSTTAANLALSFAYRGWKTALVDMDLYRPSQLKRFRIETAEQRKGIARIEGTMFYRQETALTEKLDLYGTGKTAEKAVEMLNSGEMRKMVSEMKGKYEFVILDCPPLLNSSDTLTLAGQADAAVFVLKEDKTSVGSLIDAMEMLNETSVRVLGCVINGSRIHVSRYGYGYGYGYSYGYRYGYGYGYGYGHRKDRRNDRKEKRSMPGNSGKTNN